ncbi:TPA: DNA repair protein RecO, partial [Candidatus Azambacteria bacterium]|nr:DNA repair protein RecO [Candidatus Azambacteria bacterium]
MHQTLGVVIKKHDIGEADRFLTIFTRDFGKIETTARGIRKIEAK